MTTCPSCGRENPGDARFCNACGATLAAAAIAEQRKVVTVLFCDVVGSTSLGESTDPEAMRARMRRYFDDLRRIVERHGGTVEKFVGDAVMAVFGIPLAHEDDALRAVRAASEMRQAVAEHGLESRIGVNTGEVVVGGDAETLVTGDAVNVAARLEQSARPGETLLGAQTLVLVRDAVEVEAVEPLELKGKAEPVEAFRLLELADDAAPLARRLDTPLVGRERERARLWRDYEDAVADRACRLFTLLGPAGIGKSRLVADFLEQVGDAADVLRGRCLSYGDGITYWPLVEMLLPLGIDQDSIVSSTPEETRVRFRKLLESRAAQRPQVVVVDDLQWAEPLFVDLVEHVADLSRAAPIFLLCVARTELLDARPDWGGGKLNATSVLLEPLDASECDELIGRLLGDAELDEATRHRIADVSGGNALYVEEMVAMVREQEHDAPLDVPPTIQALLQARLDLLADEERLVVGYAAVEGEVFHRGSVAELVPGDFRPELGARLAGLVRKELIRPETALLAGDDAYRFRHLLIRDAAYTALPKELRAQLHERLASWLESYTGAAFDLDEILAYHLEQAHRLLEDLGRSDGDLTARAGSRLLYAGLAANARGDLAAAAGLLRRAAVLGDEPTRLKAAVELASTLLRQGELHEAEPLLRGAIETASGLGERALLARARLAHGSFRVRTDSTATVEEELEQALEIAASLEGTSELVTLAAAYMEIGGCRFMLGHAGDGERDLERAFDFAVRSGDHGVMRDTIGGRLRPAAYGPMPAPDGIALCDSLLDAEYANVALTAHALQVRSLFQAMQGDFDGSRSSSSRSWALIEEYGFTLLKGIYAVDVGLAELTAGDLARAEHELRRGRDLLLEIGDRGVRSTADAVLSDVLCLLGREDEALDLAASSREAAASDDHDAQPRWRAARARVLARRGGDAEAMSLIQDALALAEPLDFIPLQAYLHDVLGEVHRGAGRAAEASSAFGQAAALHQQKGNVVSAVRSREAIADAQAAPS